MANSNSFVCDGGDSKAKVTELKYRPGLEPGGFVYIPPHKFLALEAGGGQEFLDETSFLRSGEEVMPPPPSPFLIDPVLLQIQNRVESIESQLIRSNDKLQQANRHFTFYMVFSLVLMTFFMITGLLCLGISLKLPPLAGLIEKLEEFLEAAGKETGVTTSVIPIPIPGDFIAGSGEIVLITFLISPHFGVPGFSITGHFLIW